MLIEIHDGSHVGTFRPGYRVENASWGPVGLYDCDQDDGLICQIVAHVTGRSVVHELHAVPRAFGMVWPVIRIDGKKATMAEVVALLPSRTVDVTTMHLLPQCDCRRKIPGYTGAACI